MGELVRLAKEALKQQQGIDHAPKDSTIRPGDRIEWQRAGAVQHGTVDFVHLDTDGQYWAFVTLGESWAVVNMKFVTGSGDA